MAENISTDHQNISIVVNPDNQKIIGRIKLIGNPVQTSDLFSYNGALQPFEIVDGHESIKDIWSHQSEVLIRRHELQRTVRFVIYPSDGENQGYLDFTSKATEVNGFSSAGRARILTKKGFAFLQSLFGA